MKKNYLKSAMFITVFAAGTAVISQSKDVYAVSTGDTLQEEAITSYPAYDEIIRKYYEGMASGWSMEDFRENDLCYLAGYEMGESSLGYCTMDINGDEPLIVTEDEYDPESGEYQEDLDAERLSILITDEGAQYCLTPSFFEYYYSGGKLANSFVWIGSCYGASNSRLVDAFVNTGANAVVGHSDSVYTAYDYNMLNTVVDKMISGESSSEAFQDARDYWGQNDEQFAIRYMEVDAKEEAPASYPSLTGDIRWE